jgi:hypothetical protein
MADGPGVNTGPTADLAGTDLIDYSSLGGPCGGFVKHPKECLPGLYCQPSRIRDVAGTCAPE